MRYFILIVMVCLLCQQAIAQNTEDLKTHHGITFNPLAVFKARLPRYKVGYIRDINEHIKVGIDFGYGREHWFYLKDRYSVENDNSYNYQLFEVRPEVFYILRPYNKKIHWYTSASLFYLHHTETYINSQFENYDRQETYYDKADYERTKYGFLLKMGFFTHVQSRLQINMSLGIGYKWRHTNFSNIEWDGSNMHTGYQSILGGTLLLDEYRTYKGKLWQPELVVDFRFYYIINFKN